MIEWYLSVKNLIRALDGKARDALALYEAQGRAATTVLNGYMKTDCQQLSLRWVEQYPNDSLADLVRHIHYGQDVDYRDIFTRDIPDLENRADAHLLAKGSSVSTNALGFEGLLHPRIIESAYELYRDGHLRESVLNAVIALFDFIRERSGCTADGDQLIGYVFSLKHPLLVLSDLGSESGQNDQKGFMQIFAGVYQGVRNSKSHTLDHDLTPLKAAQHLVLASLLTRRVEDATPVTVGG